MNGIKINNLKVNLILFLIIISYVVGFFLNEDGSGSGRYDYFNYLVVTQESLTKNFFSTFLEKGFSGYTPLHFIIYKPLNIIFGIENLRFINFLISLFVIYFFFYLLKIRFSEIKNNKIILISILPMIDPYFRSSAYWFQNEITGLIFFLFSLFFFLKFKNFENSKIDKNIFYSIFFCFLAFYAKQNYIFFLLFYYLYYFLNNKNLKFFFTISSIYFIFLLPYVYISLKLNSLVPGAANDVFHLSLDNLLIFFSFIAFYFLPFYIFNLNFLFLKKNKSKVILSLLAIIFYSYFFQYNNNLGGGVFYKLSKIIFNNNILFFISSFFGLFIFLDLICTKSLKNKLIFIPFLFVIIFLKVPYQEYLAIYFFYIYFLILDRDFIENIFNKFNTKIFLVYTYFTLFLIGSIIYNFLNLKELI
tara:strand:- start:886 stop:2136 length:1251 start_codon:yes stop_codon:yes gene_type:complete